MSEPELVVYDLYPEEKEGISDEGYFEKDFYSGRLTYYYIILNQELSTSCNDTNCELCRNDINTYCITCKYNFLYLKTMRKLIFKTKLVVL